jgi:sugar/nucleoside kinase (ribokinase family)
VIVVIGSPLYLPGSDDRPSSAAGMAVGIAAAAAALDHEVQLVGRVGEDPAGDATLLALARSGIGHVAMLRDPAHPTAAVVPGPVETDDLAILDDPTILEEPAGDGPGPAGVGPLGTATLDRDDVELALRYLGGASVIVVAEPLDPAALDVVSEATAYAGATLVLLLEDDASLPPGTDDAIVLGAPRDDRDGVFARTVGEFAAALDAGTDPASALESAVAALGWEPAGA